MATVNDSRDGESPLLDESLNEQSNVDEVISPEVDKRPLQVDSEEGTFPAIDRTPVAEEHDALTSPAVPEEANVTAKVSPGKRKWVYPVAVFILVGAVIIVFFFLQKRPKAVPTPKSVDLPLQTSSTTSEMPANAFLISPEKQQLIGVQYGTVEYQEISKSLRAVGRLAYDETKIIRISPKIEGWIEKVYVDFTGKLVKKGQPLLSIYSPDLVSTQEEYLLAIKGRRQLGESPFPEAVNFSESLAKSARRRLELWDISDAQIRELEKRGTPTRTMTLYAPTSGFVTTRNAFSKQRVTPETELYVIADLSRIWVIADIYEFEASEIKVGLPATVTLSSFPGREFKGKITYIYPELDNTTRTLKVRVELANKGFEFKPDMYADVAINISYGRRLIVPQEAVMDSGSEKLIYVSLDNGYFEPRKVELGAKVDDKFIVLAGLSEGERVVTSGNFLVDSESKLKSAAGGMGMPGMDHGASKSGEKSTPPPSQPKWSERKILYWYDSMNPAYRSDKPGKAPDGMDLVPKYADDK